MRWCEKKLSETERNHDFDASQIPLYIGPCSMKINTIRLESHLGK